MTGKEMLLTITRYVNHREKLMTSFGAFKSSAKMESISKIRRQVSFYADADTPVIKRLVLLLEPDLVNIMPGKQSRFYQSSKARLDNLFDLCKTNDQPGNGKPNI